MIVQWIALTITLAWIVLSLSSATSPVRRKNPRRPSLNGTRTLALVLLEALGIITAFHDAALFNRYLLAFGATLLACGWIISNNNTLVPYHSQKGLRRLRNRIFSLIGINRDYYYLSLGGDWIQLIGFSLLWGAASGVLYSAILFPLVAHLLTVSSIPQRPNTTDPRVLQPPSRSLIWLGWESILRLASVSGLLVLLFGFLWRDIRIFQGISENADGLLQTLIQTEATVFALVFTFLFVVIEFTTSAYTPRLARIVFRQQAFVQMVVVALLSISIKILIISRAVSFHDTGALIDWALLWTLAAVLSFVMFISRVFSLMSPEILIRETLRDFDARWVEVVKDEWGASRWRRNIYVYRDPLWRVERILASALDRGDLNSFLSGLVEVRDKLSVAFGQHDRGALDAYLAESFASLIHIAARQNLSRALENLCEIFEDVTNPSARTVKNADIRAFDEPPGCHLAKNVLDTAIQRSLPAGALAALRQLNRRASGFLQNMPAYSDLGMVRRTNSQPEIADKELEETYRRNDRLVQGYQDRYLRYFGEIAEESANAGMGDVAGMASSCVVDQISGILENIPEEPYQFMLLMAAFLAMDKTVTAACENKLERVVYLGSLGSAAREISHKEIALMISRRLSRYTVLMARAGILNWAFVVDVSIAVAAMGWKNPDTALEMLNAFGQAGRYLRAEDGFNEREDLQHLMNEMHRRIDSISSPGKRSAVRAEITKAARAAKRKLKV